MKSIHNCEGGDCEGVVISHTDSLCPKKLKTDGP